MLLSDTRLPTCGVLFWDLAGVGDCDFRPDRPDRREDGVDIV